jgi:two-component system LytT family response regulator
MLALIVDDKKLGRAHLAKLLKENCPGVSFFAEAGSVDEALKLINEHKIDLLFLDIEMPVKSGFDLLNELKQIDFEIIFCTAHNQYAIKAFKFNALDYLLKPINETELISAVQRAEENIKLKRKASTQLESLMQTINKPDKRPDKIAVSVLDGIKFIKIEDIIRCESYRNYISIYQVGNENLVVAKSIKEYEELLSEYGFYRIHNTQLINISHIKSYKKADGSGILIMDDGSKIEVSRRRKEGFLNLVNQHYLSHSLSKIDGID